MKILQITILALAAALPAWSQDRAIEDMPGYIDFSSLDSIYGEPRVMINIAGPLMNLMAAAAAVSEDAEAAALMQNLEGVRVNIYDTVGNTEPALEQMMQAKSALEAEQWQPIVQVKEERENVQMFSRIEGHLMQGMAIMVVNQEEAVFLNILGTIDPTQVGKVMDHLKVDVDMGRK